MEKTLFVSLNNDYYRVYTGYRTESWLTITSKPVYVFKLNTEVSEIKKALIDCFQNSREISEQEEENEFYLGDDFLKLINQKSWESHYNEITCRVGYIKNEFILNYTKYSISEECTLIVKTEKPKIGSIDEINIDEIFSVLKDLYLTTFSKSRSS